MILVGRYASPFVRRVAVTMQWLGMPYEHKVLSTAKDGEAIKQYNPMVKVPVMILENGEHLIESTAIIETILEMSPSQRLLPASGAARRHILQHCAIMTNSLDKAVQAIYEPVKRPPEKVHEPFLEGLRNQIHAGLVMLESVAARGDLRGDSTSNLADLTVAVGWRFINKTVPLVAQPQKFPLLAAHSARCEAMPAFQACQPEA
jgi:glutathione S-transferase